MIFPRAYGAFCEVGAVSVGGSKLDLGLLRGNELEDISRFFVVELVKLRAEASDTKIGVDLVICLEELGAVTRLDGVGFYVVAVDGIENDDVTVAAIGGDGESACLVAVEAPFDVGDRHVDVVRAIIERSLRDSGH